MKTGAGNAFLDQPLSQRYFIRHPYQNVKVSFLKMHLLTHWCHLLIMCVAAGVDVVASPEGSEAVSQLQEPTHPRFRSGLWAGSSHQCPCESHIGWYLPVPERHFSATRYAYRIFNEIGSLGERTYEKWCGPAWPPSLQKQEVLLFSGQTLVVHWSGFSPWLSLQEYPGKGLVKPSRETSIENSRS